MTKEQRLAAILELLKDGQSVQNRDLMDRFQVTDMTVRRDLDTLVRQNKVVRVHGGAIAADSLTRLSEGTPSESPAPAAAIPQAGRHELAQTGSADVSSSSAEPAVFQSTPTVLSMEQSGDLEPAYLKRIKTNTDGKHEIASVCIELLRQESYVFLDSGSTTFFIAKSITRDLPCIFITNGINIASELMVRACPHVLYIGGEIDLNTWATRGAYAESQIRTFHASIAFLGCNAISPDGNVMIGNTTELGLKRAILEVSDKIYLVADASKFESYSLTTYAHVREFDGIITDSSLPEAVRSNIAACGGKLIIPPAMEAVI